jgi:exportin-T
MAIEQQRRRARLGDDAPAFASHQSELKNKFAQVMVLFMRETYLSSWPSFFDDWFALLRSSSGDAPRFDQETLYIEKLDVFCRVLLQFDSLVVANARSGGDQGLAAKIKARMRNTCVGPLAGLWYSVLRAYASRARWLCRMVLTCIGRYADWIDIGLLVNERYIALFFDMLRSRAWQSATLKCMSLIAGKSMPALQKLQLIDRMRLLDVVAQIRAPRSPFAPRNNGNEAAEHDGSNNDDDDMVQMVELHAHVASMINVIGVELVHALLNKPDGSPALAPQAAQRALQMLQRALKQLYVYMGCVWDDVSQNCIDFANGYLDFLKQQQEARDRPVESGQLLPLLRVVAYKFQYDSASDGERYDDDEQFLALRASLQLMYTTAARLSPRIVASFVRACVGDVMPRWRSMPWQRVEMTLQLLHLLPESLREADVATMAQFFGQMAAAVISCSCEASESRAVLCIFFDLVVRFERWLPTSGDACKALLQRAMKAFFERGLKNRRHAAVRSRAAYLLLRFVRCRRAQLRFAVDGLLGALAPFLRLELERAQATAIGITFGDQQHLYELAGIVVALHASDVAHVGQVLRPLVDRLRAVLDKQLYRRDTPEHAPYAQFVGDVLMAIGTFSKGFRKGSMPADVAALFKTCVGGANRLLEAVPVASLRKSVLFLLHRMVECLRDDVFPFLPATVTSMMKHRLTIAELADFMRFLSQLCARFKVAVAPVIDQLVARVFVAVGQLVNAPLAGVAQASSPSSSSPGAAASSSSLAEGAVSEEERERYALRRVYYFLIDAILRNELAPTLVSERNKAHTEAIVSSVAVGIRFGGAADSHTQKMCMGMLETFVRLWAPSSAAFAEFAVRNMVPAALAYAFDRRLPLGNAGANMALLYVVKLIQHLMRSEHAAPSLRNGLPRLLTSSISATQAQCRQFMSTLHASYDDPKQARTLLRQWIQSYQQVSRK